MNELPTGTVTFLFSDIEGSTRLLRELRDRYAELMSDYQCLLRQVFAQHGGREIDTQGDSFFVAFPQARDAVLAAARAQRVIAEHPWPSAVDLRVRVGLHTGGASVAGDRYLGLAVHRAARICAAAHGGQTLLSQATYTLLEDEEEELAGLSMHDLGEHVLKDFDRPVRLYQLVVPGLQSDFPPLRTATAKTPFGGREGDLAEAVEAAATVPFLRRYRRPLAVAGAVVIAGAATAVGLALSQSQSHARAPISVVPNSIAEVDPQTNRVVADLRVGDTPTAVAYGVGAVWVSNTDGQTVSKVDPRTLGTQTFRVPGHPADIAAASGRVFAAELFGERLFVLGLRGFLENTITIAGGGVIRDSGLGAIAVRDDRLWLFESRRGVLVLLNATDGRIVRRVPTPRETILAFALTKDWLWATTLEQDVLRIDPVTGRVVARLSLVNALNGIAAAGNSVWVAAGTRAVELEGVANVVESTVSIGQQEPGGEAFGKGVQGIAVDGNDVWVTDPVGGRVVRIDARTGTVVRAIRVGHTPAGLVVGAGHVWVAIQA
jgi:class 3 adenylate cyclase/DNA-binding beta-propeller fold protein YncE